MEIQSVNNQSFGKVIFQSPKFRETFTQQINKMFEGNPTRISEFSNKFAQCDNYQGAKLVIFENGDIKLAKVNKLNGIDVDSINKFKTPFENFMEGINKLFGIIKQ